MADVYEEVHNNSEDATAGRRRRKRRTKRAKDKKRAKSKRRPRRRRRTKRAAAQPAMYQHPQPTVYQPRIGASAYATNPLAPTAQPAEAPRWDVNTGKNINDAIDADNEKEKPMTQSQMRKELADWQARVKKEGSHQERKMKQELDEANAKLSLRPQWNDILNSPTPGSRRARTPVNQGPEKQEYVPAANTPVSQSSNRTPSHGSSSRPRTPSSVEAVSPPMKSPMARRVADLVARGEAQSAENRKVKAQVVERNRQIQEQQEKAKKAEAAAAKKASAVAREAKVAKEAKAFVGNASRKRN